MTEKRYHSVLLDDADRGHCYAKALAAVTDPSRGEAVAERMRQELGQLAVWRWLTRETEPSLAVWLDRATLPSPAPKMRLARGQAGESVLVTALSPATGAPQGSAQLVVQSVWSYFEPGLRVVVASLQADTVSARAPEHYRGTVWLWGWLDLELIVNPGAGARFGAPGTLTIPAQNLYAMSDLREQLAAAQREQASAVALPLYHALA